MDGLIIHEHLSLSRERRTQSALMTWIWGYTGVASSTIDILLQPPSTQEGGEWTVTFKPRRRRIHHAGQTQTKAGRLAHSPLISILAPFPTVGITALSGHASLQCFNINADKRTPKSPPFGP
ncbi:hypothetical protein AB1N83_008807 [Pleurotus pulmonarius]